MVYCRPATFSVARLPKVFGCVMGRLSLGARISWRVGATDHGATAAPHAAYATGYPQSITSTDGRERSCDLGARRSAELAAGRERPCFGLVPRASAWATPHAQ